MWAKEGITGFCRGFSACFYGSTIGGFIYFTLYKIMKTQFKETMPNVDEGLVFASAGFGAEALCIGLKYPFDLIKCRLQSVNYIFKY
jgi:hypothetical protein